MVLQLAPVKIVLFRLELKLFDQVVFTVKQEDLSLNQAPVYSGLYRPSLQQEGEGQSLEPFLCKERATSLSRIHASANVNCCRTMDHNANECIIPRPVPRHTANGDRPSAKKGKIREFHAVLNHNDGRGAPFRSSDSCRTLLPTRIL